MMGTMGNQKVDKSNIEHLGYNNALSIKKSTANM